FGPGEGYSQGQSSSDSLGDAHNVRLNSEVLHCPHPAGPPHARLDFVDDQQDAILIANPAQLWQKIGGRDYIPALTHYRLAHDARGVSGWHCCSEYCFFYIASYPAPDRLALVTSQIEPEWVRVRHVRHIQNLSAEAMSLGGSRGRQRQRSESPSMKASPERDELASPG